MQLSFDLGLNSILPKVRARLLAAFGPQQADGRLDPVAQMVKTLISARTPDPLSWAAFVRLTRRWPDWARMAEAPVGEIERALHGVTFPDQKARQLLSALKLLAVRTGGFHLGLLAELSVEQAMHWLHGLPGVGWTTAAAVLNLSTLKRPALVVDANLHRIARRIGLVGRGADAAETYQMLMDQAPQGWDAEALFELHWLFKRLGQQVCLTVEPKCRLCPLNDLCARIDVDLPQTGEVVQFAVRA